MFCKLTTFADSEEADLPVDSAWAGSVFLSYLKVKKFVGWKDSSTLRLNIKRIRSIPNWHWDFTQDYPSP